jgi:hypothetical protein
MPRCTHVSAGGIAHAHMLGVTWPYLKYLMRESSCAVGRCLESRLSSLTVASCSGTGTRGKTLWSCSSSCNSEHAPAEVYSAAILTL